MSLTCFFSSSCSFFRYLSPHVQWPMQIFSDPSTAFLQREVAASLNALSSRPEYGPHLHCQMTLHSRVPRVSSSSYREPYAFSLHLIAPLN
jgi:hypothetical protein